MTEDKDDCCGGQKKDDCGSKKPCGCPSDAGGKPCDKGSQQGDLGAGGCAQKIIPPRREKPKSPA